MEQREFLKSLEGHSALQACPIVLGFRLLGRRWTIEVVRQLFLGDSKFNELLRNTPGLSPRMLSMRLQELEQNGLVRRSVIDRPPVSTEYELTSAGFDIVPVMFAMARFSIRTFPARVFLDGKPRTEEELDQELRIEQTF